MNMRGLSCRPLDSCEEMVAERRAEYYTTYLGQQGQDEERGDARLKAVRRVFAP